MVPRRLWTVLVLVLLTAGLFACTSKEEKSEDRYREAAQIEAAGRVEEAETLYREILAEYPGTPGALKAAARIAEIEKVRHLELQKLALPLLDRAREVLQGYEALYGKMPESVGDLDDGDFLFDSTYLAEMVPAGFSVRIALGVGPGYGGYRIWAIPDGGKVGFHVDGAGRGLMTLDKPVLLAEIRREYAEEANRGGLFFLVPDDAVTRTAEKQAKEF